MTDTTTLPAPADASPSGSAVTVAWATIRDALAAEALADPAQFDRATAFRQHVIRLAARWTAGQPPHTPRAAKEA
jgi:hypothetical protein